MSLDDVDGIVSQFFTFADDVHIMDTHLVVVQVTVDIEDILVLQLVAVVVDFVFQVV